MAVFRVQPVNKLRNPSGWRRQQQQAGSLFRWIEENTNIVCTGVDIVYYVKLAVI